MMKGLFVVWNGVRTRCNTFKELYFLFILNGKWEMISINFVMELPESAGFKIVMTVVNSVFKTAYFISTHTILDIREVARFFIHHM